MAIINRLANRRLATRAKKEVSAEERFRRIQEEAFNLAEKDGFKGHPDSYWLAAEEEIRRQLND